MCFYHKATWFPPTRMFHSFYFDVGFCLVSIVLIWSIVWMLVLYAIYPTSREGNYFQGRFWSSSVSQVQICCCESFRWCFWCSTWGQFHRFYVVWLRPVLYSGLFRCWLHFRKMTDGYEHSSQRKAPNTDSPWTHQDRTWGRCWVSVTDTVWNDLCSVSFVTETQEEVWKRMYDNDPRCEQHQRLLLIRKLTF